MRVRSGILKGAAIIAAIAGAQSYLMSVFDVCAVFQASSLALSLTVVAPVAWFYYRAGINGLVTPISIFLAMFFAFWCIRVVFLGLADGVLFWGLDFVRYSTQEGVAKNIFVVWSSIVLFLVSCAVAYIPRTRLAVLKKVVVLNRWSPSKGMILSSFALLMIFLSVALYLSRYGGIRTYISNWSDFRFQLGGGITFVMYIFGMSVPLVWATYLSSIGCRRRIYTRSFRAFFFAVMVMLFVLGDRSPIVILLVGLIVIRIWCVGKIRVRHLFVIVVAIIATGIFIRNIRYYTWSGGINENVLSGVDLFRMFAEVSRDFTPVDYSFYLFDEVPENVGFLWGKSFYEIPLLVIPRFLWSSKPDVMGPTVVTEQLLPSVLRQGSHINPSFLGDLYLNFGYPGMFLGSAFFGIIMGRLQRLVADCQGVAPIAAALGTCLSLVFSFWVIKEGFFGGTARFVIGYFLPLASIAAVACSVVSVGGPMGRRVAMRRRRSDGAWQRGAGCGLAGPT